MITDFYWLPRFLGSRSNNEKDANDDDEYNDPIKSTFPPLIYSLTYALILLPQGFLVIEIL